MSKQMKRLTGDLQKNLKNLINPVITMLYMKSGFKLYNKDGRPTFSDATGRSSNTEPNNKSLLQ